MSVCVCVNVSINSLTDNLFSRIKHITILHPTLTTDDEASH